VHEAELDFAEVGHDVANHDEPVVLHVNLDVVAEVRALGEEHEVREALGAAHNLVPAVLRNREVVLAVAHHRHTRRKLALARKGERVLDVLNLDRLGREERHVAANLLEVERRHRDTRRELALGHDDVVVVAVEEVEAVGRHALLLAVLEDDVEVVRVVLGDGKGERVLIRRRLDDAVEVVGVEADDEARRARREGLLLELVGVEAEVHENRARVVHRNHAKTVLVEDEAHLDKNALEGLNEGAHGARLNRLCLDDLVRHVLILLARRRLCKRIRTLLLQRRNAPGYLPHWFLHPSVQDCRDGAAEDARGLAAHPRRPLDIHLQH
jgi:hypothetical protein